MNPCIYTIYYQSSPCSPNTWLIAATGINRDHAMRLIQQLEAEGYTVRLDVD